MRGDLLLHRVGLDVGAQVHRAHLLALLQQALQPPAGLVLRLGRQLGRRVRQRRVGAQPLDDPLRHRQPCLLRLAGDAFGPHRILARPRRAPLPLRVPRGRLLSTGARPGRALGGGAMRASAASSASSASARRTAICPGTSCKARMLRLGCVPPRRQLADPARGILGPLRPVGALGRDRGCVARSGRHARAPAHRAQRRAAASDARAATSAVARILDCAPQGGQIRQRRLRLAGCAKPAAASSRSPVCRSICPSIGGEPRCNRGRLRAQPLMRRTCLLEPPFCLRPAGARLLTGCRR